MFFPEKGFSLELIRPLSKVSDSSLKILFYLQNLKKMNFSPNISERFNFLVMDYEASKSVLEELGRVLSDKSDLDLNYSKSLQRLSNSFDKMINNQYTSPNIKELLSSL